MLEQEDSFKESCSLNAAAEAYFENPSEQALAVVIEKGKGLVNYFIQIYGCGYSREDLYQTGIEGLMKALYRFNLGQGVAFSTYAAYCISGEIRHEVRRETRYYRPGVIGKLQDNIKAVIQKNIGESGSPPELTTIASMLNLREEGIMEIMKAGLIPLDQVELSKVRSLRYESFQLPIEDKITLAQALNKLPYLQKKVIYLLFYRNMTQQQASVELNINQRKVSRLLHRSLCMLRNAYE
jgi:RNA polymerase sigma-B factor